MIGFRVPQKVYYMNNDNLMGQVFWHVGGLLLLSNFWFTSGEKFLIRQIKSPPKITFWPTTKINILMVYHHSVWAICLIKTNNLALTGSKEVRRWSWNNSRHRPLVCWFYFLKTLHYFNSAVLEKLHLVFYIRYQWTWHYENKILTYKEVDLSDNVAVILKCWNLVIPSEK